MVRFQVNVLNEVWTRMMNEALSWAVARRRRPDMRRYHHPAKGFFTLPWPARIGFTWPSLQIFRRPRVFLRVAEEAASRKFSASPVIYGKINKLPDNPFATPSPSRRLPPI
jgi:hypothetical protein